VQTTAQAYTDDALDAVLGKAETPAAVATDPVEKPKTAEDMLADILSGDSEGQNEVPEGFILLEQFDVVAADLTETKEQLVVAQQDFAAFKNDVAAMLIRVADLQGKAQINRRILSHPNGHSNVQLCIKRNDSRCSSALLKSNWNTVKSTLR